MAVSSQDDFSVVDLVFDWHMPMANLCFPQSSLSLASASTIVPISFLEVPVKSRVRWSEKQAGLAWEYQGAAKDGVASLVKAHLESKRCPAPEPSSSPVRGRVLEGSCIKETLSTLR